jgi:hypothetical protein
MSRRYRDRSVAGWRRPFKRQRRGRHPIFENVGGDVLDAGLMNSPNARAHPVRPDRRVQQRGRQGRRAQCSS